MTMEMLRAYPYLVFCLGMLVVLGGAMAFCRPAQRKLALLSGLLTVPFGFSSVLVVPAYWTPRRLCEFLGAGIEDLIFSFIVGGMVWLCASCPWRGRIGVRVRPRCVLKRYALSGLCGLSLVLMAQGLGCHPMTGLIVSFLTATAVILLVNPGLWPMAAAGGPSFALAYMVQLRVTFWAVPDFLWQWNSAGFWGQTVLGVPIGEAMWAAGYGTVWPLFLSLLFQARIFRRPATAVFRLKQ